MDELAKTASSLRLVTERIIDFPIGLTCVATESFSKRSGTLKKGHFVIPRSVESDGSVRMDDGDRLIPGFRFFSPLPLVREVPAAPFDCILAEVKPGDPLLSEVLSSKSRRRWILFSTQPDVIRNELAGPITIQINQKRAKTDNDFGPGSPAPGEYEMPPLSFWLEGLERWRRTKKIALTKEPKKPNLKMELPAQRKTPEIPSAEVKEVLDGHIPRIPAPVVTASPASQPDTPGPMDKESKGVEANNKVVIQPSATDTVPHAPAKSSKPNELKAPKGPPDDIT